MKTELEQIIENQNFIINELKEIKEKVHSIQTNSNRTDFIVKALEEIQSKIKP